MPKRSVERPSRRNALGAEGERRAADFLKKRGYRIIARNVRADGVEMDVIARRGPLLVFVEVKTRRSRNLGSPEDAVNARKRARLIRGATAWLHQHGQGIRRARFDVIVCECDENEQGWQLRHLEAAFDANG